MMIRPYRQKDLEAVLTCFDHSVQEIGAKDYTPEQTKIWASSRHDRKSWASRLASGGVFVAEMENLLAGFVRVEKSGLVDLLYVEPRFERRGVGRALLKKACSWAKINGEDELWSDVSIAARPLFESMGFKVKEKQIVVRQGMSFKNYRMIRVSDLDNGKSTTVLR